MRELVRIVEDPRPCSYLPDELASLEYRLVDEIDTGAYEHLLERGYRRFGRQLFRPCCPSCRRCVSIRYRVDEFMPSPGLRRIRRKNSDIEVRREPVYMTERHLDLYRRYHEHMAETKGWSVDSITPPDYYESFVAAGGDFASQWLYLKDGELLGVALMDETPQAISLVYFFHDPAWRPLSPGTFSILVQLEYARSEGKRYAYPGYWIEANPSMSYKARFQPFEVLIGDPRDEEEPEWTRRDEAVGELVSSGRVG